MVLKLLMPFPLCLFWEQFYQISDEMSRNIPIGKAVVFISKPVQELQVQFVNNTINFKSFFLCYLCSLMTSKSPPPTLSCFGPYKTRKISQNKLNLAL